MLKHAGVVQKNAPSSSGQVIRVISKKPACRAGGDPTQDVKLTETTASPWPLFSFPSFLYVRSAPYLCFFPALSIVVMIILLNTSYEIVLSVVCDMLERGVGIN